MNGSLKIFTEEANRAETSLGIYTNTKILRPTIEDIHVLDSQHVYCVLCVVSNCI